MTDMYESFKKSKKQIKNQLLEENPNKELDVMRELKVMDDIMKQVSELTSNTLQQHDQLMDELKYQHAIKESHSLQDKK